MTIVNFSTDDFFTKHAVKSYVNTAYTNNKLIIYVENSERC